MEIKVRRISEKYIEIKVVIENAIFDLGLFDYGEAKAFADELEDGVLDIRYGWPEYA